VTYVIRTAGEADLEALYEMAKSTGGGFTNLPPDRDALGDKLARSAKAFARTDDEIGDDLFVFVMEDTETGMVRGTCQVMSQVGQKWPFYSYRLNAQTQHSKELDRTVRAELLSLVTDLEGSSEVGGLFLHPTERSGGKGLLLARSRYLFIAMHRLRFAERIIAELRGIIDERGGSPFWDGVAGRFFGMTFQEADYFNAINGNQFIADLMPKHPVYIAMLDEGAKEVIGLPHPSGRAAMRMLELEGFSHEGYVDIFDGGPTMTARTSQVHSIAQACPATVSQTDLDIGERAILATGKLGTFRACFGHRELGTDGSASIDARSAKMLGAAAGGEVWSVAR
jgi:arginine N-succinyltransferase